MTTKAEHPGSCLCGAVKFEVTGDLPPGDGCHCSKCRKWTGHYLPSTDVPRSSVVIYGEANIRWYQSSPKVRRGFCSTCGSSLFFDPVQQNWLGIALGAFDGPTKSKLKEHIFVAEKGDYYELDDSVSKHMGIPDQCV